MAHNGSLSLKLLFTRALPDWSGGDKVVHEGVRQNCTQQTQEHLHITAVPRFEIARHVVQVLSESDGRALLKNLFAATRPGGVLFLIGWILDNSRATPENTVGYNLILLSNYADGQAYTEGEYFEWLAEAGFEDTERTVFEDGESIIRARRPAS